jgi:hypothetical protein
MSRDQADARFGYQAGKQEMNLTTNQTPIVVITTTAAFLAAMCVWTICWLAYKGIQIPPELNTLTGTLCGYLTGTLTKTTPTETTRQTTPLHVPSGGSPTPLPDPLEVVGLGGGPVKTKETK